MRIVVKTLERARETAALLARQYQQSPDGLVVTIEPWHRPSTRSQKAKIHVMISDMADHLGYYPDELKAVLKQKAWPQKLLRLPKGDIAIPKSTRELSTEEASQLIEKLLHICGEYGIPTRGD